MSTTNVLPNLQGLELLKVGDLNPVPSSCIFDTENTIGADADTSNTVCGVGGLQVDVVPIGTQALVQAKLHRNASWVTLWDSDTDVTPTPVDRAYIQMFQNPYPFMRVVRIGTGVVKAYSSSYSTG